MPPPEPPPTSDSTVTVAGDACAAPDLEFRGVAVPAAAVNAAILAALANSCGHVVGADELVWPTRGGLGVFALEAGFGLGARPERISFCSPGRKAVVR